jgi:4-hydroxy 2-oxovalerate aldolase
MKRKIIISDVTLRDGNHAAKHQINRDIIKKYCEFAEEANINILEVGHGNGIGASSLSIGRTQVSDKKMLITARKYLKKTKLSIHSIPGFSTLDNLKLAIDCGVDIIRIGNNSTEIDTITKQVEFCRKNKIEAWGVLMMFHLIYKNGEYLEKISFLKKIGLKTIIIMDSAGCFLPEDIKKIFLSIKKMNLNFGFHAHNNFGCALINSIQALECGANILDASLRGFGAGAGNTQLEILLSILINKKKMSLDYDLEKIYKMSENFRSLLERNNVTYSDPFSEPMNILSANFGLFSGFASQVNSFSKKFKLSKLDSFKAIAKKNLVAGQEDLIMNIIYNLKNNKM